MPTSAIVRSHLLSANRRLTATFVRSAPSSTLHNTYLYLMDGLTPRLAPPSRIAAGRGCVRPRTPNRTTTAEFIYPITELLSLNY